MSGNAREDLIASLITSFFSDRNLSMDSFLLLSASNWIPIAAFESPVRLGKLAADEVVVAKAARKSCSSVEVSQDGKNLRRKQTPSQKHLDALRMSLVFLDNLPHGTTARSLCEQVPCIDRIHLPLTSILHQSRVKPFSSVFDSSLLELLDLKTDCAQSKSNLDLKLPGFVFATLKKGSNMSSLSNHGIGTRFKLLELGNGNQAVEYIQQELQHANSCVGNKNAAFEYVRVMSMREWHEKMVEYASVMKDRKSQLEDAMASKSGTHNGGAIFEPGVVAFYSGVHKDTSRKTLKQLFELWSPVSFLDYSKYSTEGYVRFKTAEGAAAAARFLKLHTIVQLDAKDLGTLITSAHQLKKLKMGVDKNVSNDDEVGGVEHWGDEYGADIDAESEEEEAEKNFRDMGIKLRVLEGYEESEYWE